MIKIIYYLEISLEGKTIVNFNEANDFSYRDLCPDKIDSDISTLPS